MGKHLMSKMNTLLSNLTFPEGPRWHNGVLWFSDFSSHEVITVDENGTRSTIVSVPEQPSGLGWDTQGDLLIVSCAIKNYFDTVMENYWSTQTCRNILIIGATTWW